LARREASAMNKPSQAKYEEIAAQMVRRFGTETKLDRVNIADASYAAVIFAAKVAASAVCYFTDKPAERAKGLQTLIDSFSEHAKDCVREISKHKRSKHEGREP
jgi:hypothetical protein